MNKSTLINEIMRDYDRDRQQAERLKASRLEEVYNGLPRVLEIDNELASAGIEIAKAIVSRKDFSAEDLARKNKALQDERETLLNSAGLKKDYIEDVFKCDKCKDTGFVESARCTCLKQRLISRYYDMSNLKNILDKENFDNFELQYYSEKTAPDEGMSPKDKIKLIYQLAIKFVSEFESNPTNLLFYGKTGLGKTFMCNCIAKDILDRGHTVLYVTAGRLFKTVEDARFNRDEMVDPAEQIDFFYSADLLIIDDLGTEFSTLATQSALFDIVNSRILEKKPTIISSNLSLRDIEQQYSDRLVSRFQGNYEFHKFLGEDIRQLKKYRFIGKK